MEFNRRDFGKLALAAGAVPSGILLAAKPNSDFDGVQIGLAKIPDREPRLGID